MQTKSAFVAIVGRPNVGKSTLLNQLVGEKVAIVSNKPQTTRNRITGVLTQGDTQMVFLDTPGWHDATTRLGDYMVRQVKESLVDIDLALLVTDASAPIRDEEIDLLETMKQRGIPTVLVLNKIDQMDDKQALIPRMADYAEKYDFIHLIPVSALTGDGVDILLEEILTKAKPGPHYFDKDDYTDQPERVIIAEIIREKLLRNLWDELPHGIAVGVDQMSERPEGGLIDIDATIFCERASHKGMIIGKKGRMLQKVGSQARTDMEAFLGTKVNLQLWVKIKEDWRNREKFIKEFGYE